MNFTRSLSESKSSQKSFPIDKTPSSPSEKSNKSVSETPSLHVKLPASICGIHIFESKETDDISLKLLSTQEHLTVRTDDTVNENVDVNNAVEKPSEQNAVLSSSRVYNILSGKNTDPDEKMNGSLKDNLNIESTSYNGVSSRL